MSRSIRRVAFAAPLVVVMACAHAPESHHRHHAHHHHDDDDPAQVRVTLVVQPPVQVAPDTTEPAPIKRHAPRNLVTTFEPLHRELRYDEACQNLVEHCPSNPPRPANVATPTPPPVAATFHGKVDAIMRDGDGARVRIDHRREDHLDLRSWRVVFVGPDGEVPGSDCTIHDWDYRELECTTARAPEALVDRDGFAFDVLVIPPRETVERDVEARAAWEAHPLPPPPPPEVPRQPVTARSVKVQIVTGDTVVTVASGSDAGIQRGWTATFVDDTGTPLTGGACKILRITKNETFCQTTLTLDQIYATPHVRVSPP